MGEVISLNTNITLLSRERHTILYASTTLKIYLYLEADPWISPFIYDTGRKKKTFLSTQMHNEATTCHFNSSDLCPWNLGCLT